ncbi:MAG: peptidoglycan editing factor PgeF, partial [Pseudomonadota bacterium]|nr:peptidoglycan editing factor PgeF [Pseudomonadota bacterium]
LNQVHGAAVADIREPGEPLSVDGLITRTEHVACCVLTADCLPVFLASNRGDEVAIAHAGWRGIAAGVIENTVHRMRSSIAELVAWLGPAIGSCHFEVGEEVRAQVIDSEEGPLANCFVATGNEKKYMADLSRIAMVKLQKLGITNIYVDNTCTYCDADRFFSFRRDGKTGRMACLIYIDGPVL